MWVCARITVSVSKAHFTVAVYFILRFICCSCWCIDVHQVWFSSQVMWEYCCWHVEECVLENRLKLGSYCWLAFILFRNGHVGVKQAGTGMQCACVCMRVHVHIFGCECVFVGSSGCVNGFTLNCGELGVEVPVQRGSLMTNDSEVWLHFVATLTDVWRTSLQWKSITHRMRLIQTINKMSDV